MSPQNAAAQLLYKIVRGVIPQSDKEQGMPPYPSTSRSLWFLCTHSMIACTSSPQQICRQDYTFLLSDLSCTGQKVSVVIGRQLT
jgi:hypothetical protein